MPLVRDTIANFIGGVSQQPDKLMYPNQSKTLVNYLLSPQTGLKDRPPTEHIAKLMNTLNIHPKCTTIIKEDEEYEVILTGTGIKVFDLAGNEKTVNIESANLVAYETATYTYTYQGKSYVQAYNDKGQQLKGQYDFTFTYTFGNFTVNFVKRIKTSKPASYTNVANLELNMEVYNSNGSYYGTITALDIPNTTVTVKKEANIDYTYSPSTYITSANPLYDLDTITIGDYTFVINKNIITEMYEETYPNPYSNSALVFVRQGDYKTDYKVTVTYGGTSTTFTYTTTTDAETTKTNKIATQLTTSISASLTAANGWNVQRVNSCILIKRTDGASFEIKVEDSNADYNLYAFYGEANGLDVLPTTAPNNFILKVVGEEVSSNDDYYVQFQTTDGTDFGLGAWKECPSPKCKYAIKAQTMPHGLVREADGTFTLKILDWGQRNCGDEDSAPTPSFIGNTIQEMFTHKGRLGILSSDKVCFSDTQDIFSFFRRTTLTSLDTDPIDISSNAKMVLLRHSLPFNEELLTFSETTIFSIKGGDIFSNTTVGCNLITEYPCSKYVKPINTGATALFLFENGDYSRVMELYITSTYSIDARDVTEQIPSYLLKNMYKIAGSTANNLACFLTTADTSKIFVYNYYYSSEQKAQSAWSEWEFKNAKILNVDFKDNWLYLVIQYSDGIYLEKMNFSPKNKENNLDYLFYLDRKVYFNNITSANNVTTITLPYTPDNTVTVLNTSGFPLDYTISGKVITIEGTYTSLIAGNTFKSLWEMPLIFVRQQTQNGGLKVKEGILMLRDINLCYAETGYFRIKVTPAYNTNITSEFEFTGKISGMKSATLGQINVSDGTFLLPVIAKNDEIKIEVINDGYLPSCFLSLEWLGDFNIRGQ